MCPKTNYNLVFSNYYVTIAFMKYLFSICLFIAGIQCIYAGEAELRIPLVKAKLLAKQSRTDDAKQLLEYGLYQAKKNRNEIVIAEYYLALADLLLSVNEVDSLESYYATAAYFFVKYRLKEEAILAKTGRLEVLRRTNPSSTMEKYLSLLAEARTVGNKDVYYNVLDKIILVNIGMENYAEAFSELHECIQYYRSTHDTLRFAMKYREIGALYFSHYAGKNGSDFEKDSCLYYHREAIKLFYQLHSYRNLVLAYQRLSWLLYQTDLKTAWKYIQIADSIDKRYHIQTPQLPNIMSFSLFKMGRVEEAVAKSKESLRLGIKAHQLFIGIQAADQLCTYYKVLKRSDSALFYKELSALYNDSIRSQKHYRDAVKMQAKLEFDKELFQKEITQTEELKRQKLIKNYSLVGILLLIVIGSLIYRAYLVSQKNAHLISKQNEEKAFLLREIHHRVKNNLTIVASILDLQQREIKNEELIPIFKEAKLRINSMALVHKNLYEQDDFSTINAQQYFEGLYKTIYNAYKPKEIEIESVIACKMVSIDIDSLIPLALITNELLTNSFKYAFAGKSKGKISIELSKTGNEFLFTYTDDGVGMPKEEGLKGGMGTLLINGLCKQISGTLHKIVAQSGVNYKITFTGNTHNSN